MDGEKGQSGFQEEVGKSKQVQVLIDEIQGFCQELSTAVGNLDFGGITGRQDCCLPIIAAKLGLVKGIAIGCGICEAT